MTAIQIKKQFDSYLPLLSKQQQELVLDMIKNILQINETEKKITLDEYNQEIDESLKQIEKGDFATQEYIAKMIKKWQKRKRQDNKTQNRYFWPISPECAVQALPRPRRTCHCAADRKPMFAHYGCLGKAAVGFNASRCCCR